MSWSRNVILAVIFLIASTSTPLYALEAGDFPAPGFRVIDTAHGFGALVKKLNGAIKGNGMAAVTRASATKGAASLGVTVFKIFPGRVASAKANEGIWTLSVFRLRSLAQQLAARNIHLTPETHGNTLCDTQESTLRLLEDLGDLPNLGLCFQPYTDQDTDAAIACYDALAPHVRHVHLQNRTRADNACCLLSEGDWIDYRRLLPHIKASGFDGPLSLEFTADMATPEDVDFDIKKVLDNAAQDRDFALEIWQP